MPMKTRSTSSFHLQSFDINPANQMCYLGDSNLNITDKTDSLEPPTRTSPYSKSEAIMGLPMQSGSELRSRDRLKRERKASNTPHRGGSLILTLRPGLSSGEQHPWQANLEHLSRSPQLNVQLCLETEVQGLCSEPCPIVGLEQMTEGHEIEITIPKRAASNPSSDFEFGLRHTDGSVLRLRCQWVL